MTIVTRRSRRSALPSTIACVRLPVRDGWHVDIRVEKIVRASKGGVYPACVAGERAGPPEDCGGIEGYQDMICCLQHPETDLGHEWRVAGRRIRSEKCDLDAVNKALKRLAKTAEPKAAVDVGSPPFRQAQGPEHVEGLSADRSPMDNWPGDKRRPYDTIWCGYRCLKCRQLHEGG